ncbi:MAG: CHAP domain-containing protein [Flavobacteriales bacterium]
MRRFLAILSILALLGGLAWYFKADLPIPAPIPLAPGTPLDSLHGVVVYHNGSMSNVSGRNVVDGYNVGLRYQCVEFVKRYYLEHYGHRMPNSYGHAKDFFDASVKDGALSADRGLLQFTNPSPSKPAVGDLLILDGWGGNAYGHVAIVSEVSDGELEVVQQNTGSTRGTYDVDLVDGKWRVESDRVLAWSRMP